MARAAKPTKTATKPKPIGKTAGKPPVNPAVKLALKSSPGDEGLTDVTKLDASTASEQVLNRNEFLDRVVAASGLKRKDVKSAMDAMLDVLGAALVAGEELNLRPMGKLKVVRSKETDKAHVVTCRLRRQKDSPAGGAGSARVGGSDPAEGALAEPAE